jgi:aminopeptidase-like protein
VAGVDWSTLPGAAELGDELHGLMAELYPICRSLTGDGVRQTLAILERDGPLEITEVPSGTQVYDWTLPREWNIHDAWLASPDGTRVVDFRKSNLHVLGYSVPVNARLPLSELRQHLFTHPENPDWIPFRTSYYDEKWGFCLSQTQLDQLPEGEYEVVIDSSLEHGHVTYAEAHVPGELEDEVLFSTYICHPSLCNDNLSGIVLTAGLAKYLRRMELRYSYRFLFGPGTIGPLCWLWRNEDDLKRVKHGLVLACVGDPGPLTYKRSRLGDAEIDQAAANIVRAADGSVIPFEPWGGDERQFCSPGFNLPVGALTRSPADHFPGYHSSADDLDLVQPSSLADSLRRCLEIVDVLETNQRYRNLNPKGEPQLGKRGLYRSVAGGSSREAALLWVLNLSDGVHSLLDISDRSGLPYPAVRKAAEALLEHDLLEDADTPG